MSQCWKQFQHGEWREKVADSIENTEENKDLQTFRNNSKKIVVDLKQKVYIFNIIKCYSILCWEVDRHSLHD